VGDLVIAQRMGWRYEWVAALPIEVYDILRELLSESHGD
jgi:hypothetical protein